MFSLLNHQDRLEVNLALFSAEINNNNNKLALFLVNKLVHKAVRSLAPAAFSAAVLAPFSEEINHNNKLVLYLVRKVAVQYLAKQRRRLLLLYLAIKLVVQYLEIRHNLLPLVIAEVAAQYLDRKAVALYLEIRTNRLRLLCLAIHLLRLQLFRAAAVQSLDRSKVVLCLEINLHLRLLEIQLLVVQCLEATRHNLLLFLDKLRLNRHLHLEEEVRHLAVQLAFLAVLNRPVRALQRLVILHFKVQHQQISILIYIRRYHSDASTTNSRYDSDDQVRVFYFLVLTNVIARNYQKSLLNHSEHPNSHIKAFLKKHRLQT